MVYEQRKILSASKKNSERNLFSMRSEGVLSTRMATIKKNLEISPALALPFKKMNLGASKPDLTTEDTGRGLISPGIGHYLARKMNPSSGKMLKSSGSSSRPRLSGDPPSVVEVTLDDSTHTIPRGSQSRTESQGTRRDAQKLTETVKHSLQNIKALEQYKSRLERYHDLFENKLEPVGFDTEQQLLKYFCDKHLIENIPDDYEGFVERVKLQIKEELNKRKFDEHGTILSAMDKLAVNLRDERALKGRMLAAKRKKLIDMASENTNDPPEVDRIEYFKKHRRDAGAVGENFYTTQKIKDWSVSKGRTVTPQLQRQFEELSDRISGLEQYYQKLHDVTRAVVNLRQGLYDDRKEAGWSTQEVQAEINFAHQMLAQYRDDSHALIADVEKLMMEDEDKKRAQEQWENRIRKKHLSQPAGRRQPKW